MPTWCELGSQVLVKFESLIYFIPRVVQEEQTKCYPDHAKKKTQNTQTFAYFVVGLGHHLIPDQVSCQVYEVEEAQAN